MKTGIVRSKALKFVVCNLHLAALLSGCAAFQITGEVQKGRAQLLFGEPKVALAHFERAAQLDPNHVSNLSLTPLRQGIWTYVGRAHYVAGNLPESRKALERAVSLRSEDYLGRLYLGAVLVRDGERAQGLKETEGALKELEGFLDYMDQYHPDGRFWDPAKALRSQIERDLALIRGKDVDWSQLVASAEWLGKEFEEEIDRVKRDKHFEEIRDTDNGVRDN